MTGQDEITTNVKQHQDGEGSAFGLGLDDEEIRKLVSSAVKRSRDFWKASKESEDFDLDEVREENHRLWRGNHYADIRLHRHQVPYVDNRIGPSIETAISIVTTRTPQPDVQPGGDDVISKLVAKNLQKALYDIAAKDRLQDKLKIAARQLYLDRVAIIKMLFDEDEDRIRSEVPDSDCIVIDKDARLFEEPGFLAHKMSATVQRLIHMYPDAEAKILKYFNIQQKRISTMTTAREYWEVHFSYYEDDTGQRREGVAWFLGDNLDVVLGSQPTSHWADEREDKFTKNFFSSPKKPYILGNFLNRGNYLIDDVTVTEWAIPLQYVLNKRGRQIVENADNASGGIVYNTRAIKKKEMAKLIGAPDEKIGVAMDVDKAFARVAPPLLPSYVLEDKYDARNVIDNMFATHAPTRGGDSQNRTLGQDVLQQNQDLTRQDQIVKVIEQMATEYFQHCVQMIKLFYTKNHYLKVNGKSGQFQQAMLNADMISDGIDVSVKAGSSMPLNKQQLRNDSLELARLGLIDVRSLYENLGFENPDEMAEKLMLQTNDPASYLSMLKEDEKSQDAMMDIEILNRGELAKARQVPDAAYLKFRTDYMMSAEFKELDPKIQQLHVENLQANIASAQASLQEQQTQVVDPFAAAQQGAAGLALPQTNPLNGTGNPLAPSDQARQGSPVAAQGVQDNAIPRL